MLHINNQKVSSSVYLCNTFFKRLRGLMFTKEINDTAYVFVFAKPTKVPLHMWWVFYPIDILWLNEDCTINQIEIGAKPFRSLIAGKFKSKYVVELPKNTIDQHKIRVGQKCKWE